MRIGLTFPLYLLRHTQVVIKDLLVVVVLVRHMALWGRSRIRCRLLQLLLRGGMGIAVVLLLLRERLGRAVRHLRAASGDGRAAAEEIVDVRRGGMRPTDNPSGILLLLSWARRSSG